MPTEIPRVLRESLPANQQFEPRKIWVGEPDERPSNYFDLDDNDLWNFWHLGPKNVRYSWGGAIRGLDNVHKFLILESRIALRRALNPQGQMLVPFYLANRNYLRPVVEGGPRIPGFDESSTKYGEHGTVLAAYRGDDLFAAGGCALPSTLRIVDVPLEQLYEELASPNGGEIFTINPTGAPRT